MIRILIPLLIWSAFQDKKGDVVVPAHDYILEITTSPLKDLPDDGEKRIAAIDRHTLEIAKRWMKAFGWDPTFGVSIVTETPTWTIYPKKKESFDFAKLKSVFEKHEIKKLHIEVVGGITVEDPRVWLTPANGQKLLIENRPVEKGKKLNDVVSWIRDSMKAEIRRFRITGDVAVDKSGVRVLADVGRWVSDDEAKPGK